MTCIHYIPWDRYDSSIVRIAECEHWSGNHCQRHDTPNSAKTKTLIKYWGSPWFETEAERLSRTNNARKYK